MGFGRVGRLRQAHDHGRRGSRGGAGRETTKGTKSTKNAKDATALAGAGSGELGTFRESHTEAQGHGDTEQTRATDAIQRRLGAE